MIIMLVIFIFSATPSNELPNFGGSDTLIKKGSHMLGYGLLTLAYLRGINGVKKTNNSNWLDMVLALVLAVIYAMTDEYHQSFVYGRNSRWADVGIDTIGGAIGLLLWEFLPAVKKITQFQLPSSTGEVE